MQVHGIAGIDAPGSNVTAARVPTSAPGTVPFGTLVEQLLSQASTTAAQANQAVQELALGRTDNLHEVLLRVAQADLAFRLVLEIRNRLTEAYQEILRMQV
ncbi:Flagellar hook-basal body complex protein FliE [bacterium HR36]|nr:Flagellar hook-basal body complex protein FliE [bacterium HR36]